MDYLESLENSVENTYFDMYQGNGKLKCFCGKIYNEVDAVPATDNPYSPPICPTRADELMQEYKNNKSLNLNKKIICHTLNPKPANNIKK
jgi:hypothetical protein